MAYHKSSIKRIRSTETKRISNRYHARTVRNSVKNLKGMENKEEAVKDLPKVVSQIDKLAKRGVIHRNKAANLKSKLMKQITAPKEQKAE